MSDTEPSSRPRPTGSAKAVLLTLLGELVLPAGGETWTGTLIDGLGALGFSDRNARQALTRLRSDGLTASTRHGRQTRWRLTPAGERLLRTGAERIYQFGRHAEPWDERWVVVVCAVPEAKREKRRRLRTQLTFAGFGFLSPTVAVSPRASTLDTATTVLTDLDLLDLATVFVAETAAVTDDTSLVLRSWDLDALGEAYLDFVAEFATTRPAEPEASFCQLIRLVHAWRQFPFADPDLPAELLPDQWAGTVARRLFDEGRATWSGPATAYYRQLEARHGP